MLPLVPERASEPTIAVQIPRRQSAGGPGARCWPSCWSRPRSRSFRARPRPPRRRPSRARRCPASSMSGSSMSGSSDVGVDEGDVHDPVGEVLERSGHSESMNMSAMAGLGVTDPHWKYTGPALPAGRGGTAHDRLGDHGQGPQHADAQLRRQADVGAGARRNAVRAGDVRRGRQVPEPQRRRPQPGTSRSPTRTIRSCTTSTRPT